jgi:hypothetical protein
VCFPKGLRPFASCGRLGKRADDEAGVSEKHGANGRRTGFYHARLRRANSEG